MSHSSEDDFVFSLKKLPRMSFCSFQAMRCNGDLCDVTFHVSGKKISAHRVILAAHIPYFSEVFLHDPDASKREIIFEMTEAFAFESLIEFAYTGEIKINIDNARSLLIGATLLKMGEIRNICMKFISSRLHPGNALEIRNFASSRNFVALKEAAEEYVLKHFVEISHSEGFLSMPLGDLRELISKDELHVTSEEEVFEAVITWVKKSPSNRKNKLLELLNVVRMPLLSYHYLSTYVAGDELIKNSTSCANLVNEAKGYWTNRSSVRSNLAVGHRHFSVNYMTKNNSTDYKDNDYFYALCSLTGKEAYPTVVVRYNLGTAEWKTMDARTTYVRGAAVAIMDKKLYVIGGHNKSGKYLDAVQVFDIESDSRSFAEPFPSKIDEAAAAVSPGKINVFSGKSNYVAASSSEYCISGERKWSFAEPFPSKIDEAGAAVSSGKIYVFGGKTNYAAASSYVYCFSPETKWKYVGKMYHSRISACAVTVNDSIYIFGGSDDKKALTSAEMYDPKNNEWKKIVSSAVPELFCGGGDSTNRIYAYGNEYVYFYDDRLNEWDRICNVPRQDIGCVSLLAFEGRLYVVGGKSEKKSCENYLYIYDLETDKWISGNALPRNLNFVCAVGLTKH